MTDTGKLSPQPLTDQISAAMFHNAGLFLKKAAEEIAAHGDGSDAAFDVDRATLVTVLMQICGSAWKRDPGSGVIGVEKGPLIPLV